MSKIALDLPTLEPAGKETVNQWAYRRLRQAVMIGRVTPGTALTIRDLAESLGVSTMPVREALRRLSAEKALEVRDNRRVMVPEMNPAKFRELCELRIALETHAAERALPFVNLTLIDEMAAIDDRIDDAYAAGEREIAMMRNQDFHRHLYAANPNQTAMPLIESVWLQLGPFTQAALAKLEDHYLIDRHVEALEALRRQDAKALRDAIEADIRDGICHIDPADLSVRTPE